VIPISAGSTGLVDSSSTQIRVDVNDSASNESCADAFVPPTTEPEPVIHVRTTETGSRSHSDHYSGQQRRQHGAKEKPEGTSANEEGFNEAASVSAASASAQRGTGKSTATNTKANADYKAPPSSSSSPPLRSGSSSIDNSRKERAMRIYNKIMFLPRKSPLDQSMIVAAEGCLDELARLPPSASHARGRNGEVNADANANANANANADLSPADVAIKLFQRLKDQSVTLTGQMYEYTIQALAKQRDRVSEADALLREYIAVWEGQKRRQQQRKPSRHKQRQQRAMKPPNSILISSVINAHAKDQDNFNAEPAQRAEHLLRTMVRLHDEYADADGASPFAPNTISFTSVIDAWSRRRYAPKAERLLNWMEEYGASYHRMARADVNADEHNASILMGYGPVIVRPNAATYNAVVAAWSRAATDAKRNQGTTRNIDRTEAAENAERMLHRMIDTEGGQPDAITYASVLSAWANSPQQPYGAGRADDILLQMEHALDDAFMENSASASPRAAVPNVVCYNTVLHGWSNANNPERAEEVLCRMVERNERYPLVAPAPNVASFNLTALAWARSGRQDAGRKAQDLLEAMEGMSSAACGAAAAANAENKSDATKANVRPDVVTYNTVLDGWLRGSTIENALCAEELLDSMERGERTVKPDIISFNLVIGAWAKAGEETSRQQQQRQGSNRRSSGVSHINSNGGINTAERAEEILHRMDVAGVQPDTISFNSCISAWSKSGRGTEAADRAEALLLAMEELHKRGKKKGKKSNTRVHPDAITYSAVINAIAQSGDRDAPFRAEAVLARMETMAVFKRSTAKPNTYTYNGILNCWAKSASDISEAAQKADDILSRMEEGGHNMPAPDLVSYCTVVNAWSRSSHPDKATRARQVLDRMMTMTKSISLDRNGSNAARYVRNAHNMVLSCCAYTPREAHRQSREAARQIAIQTYEDIHSQSSPVQPDDATYSNFLLVCGHLFGKDAPLRERLVEAVMTDCRDRNLVTDRVLERMERVVPSELREKVMARIDNVR